MQPITTDGRIGSNFRAGDSHPGLRQTVAEMLRTRYSGFTHRYTDGSKTENGVGFGVASAGFSISKKLPDACTVFTAELAAIFVAVTTTAEQPILVLTDSMSAISALQSEVPKHPTVQAILQHAPRSTVFTWVPGHCGIPGNEDADVLARAGIQAEVYSPTVPFPDVKRWISSTVRQAWADQWARTDLPFIRKVKGSIGKWTDVVGLRDQRIISRLRTGHTRLSYGYGGGPFRKICDICRMPASTEHILCVCPQYQRLRTLWGLSGSIRDILADSTSNLTALLCFLKDAGLYHKI